MSDTPKQATRWSKMKDSYRLVVMNEETFEERGSYRLSLLNVYLFVSTVFVLIAALVALLFFYTPLGTLVPGYGSTREEQQIRELNKTITLLEKQMVAQQIQTNSLRQMLVKDVEPIPKENEVSNVTEEYPDEEIEPEPPSEEEIELRNEIIAPDRTPERQAFLKVKDENTHLEQLYFTPPVSGSVSLKFLPNIKHYGVDVLAAKNTPVKAAMDGFVTFSDWTLETGYTIGIQHDNEVITYYKHNSALLKEVGDDIQAGEAIAIIGNTGTKSTGPHLHFELWHNGIPLDPEQYINF